jgi:hypothetical protein
MAETRIWFVTWPDGKILEGTQTSVAEEYAIDTAIVNYLPKAWFPGLRVAYVRNHLWECMRKAGFRVQSVSTEATGVSL